MSKMVKDSIKIFARLKHQENVVSYRIEKTSKYEDLILFANNSGDFINNKRLYHKFRFFKVFDQESRQEEIFNDVAKPIVQKVLAGYNGTIFAYGQTGSGKTYTITGSPNNYDERGIIPRSIQEIFAQINSTDTKHKVYISYLEIYKEVGYDLLNPRQQATSMEELPRVFLLEDSKGEAHLRNLSMPQVSTEEEAMKLLFIGDTNKTMAETPMNDSSSRSHCVFTIYIDSQEKDQIVKRSKLHLVDLAGSERIYKSNVNGVVLSEAKHINLSLHYLEQVILALSQSNRTHIPFRNSMMTCVLRDSLNGNSVTAMLATVALAEVNLDETISTCKFAQRVSMINTEVIMNEVYDPQKEVCLLKKEIQELRAQLFKEQFTELPTTLTTEQKDHCKVSLKKYLENTSDTLEIESKTEHIQYCFKLLKVAIRTFEKQNKKFKVVGDSYKAEIVKYKMALEKKDKEIDNLKLIIHKDMAAINKNEMQTSFIEDLNLTTDSELSPKCPESELKVKPPNITQLKQCIHNLCDKYELANEYTAILEQCKQNIIHLKSKTQKVDAKTVENVMENLSDQQNIYKNVVTKLKKLKSEIEIAKAQLNQMKKPKTRKYKNCFTSFQKQIAEDFQDRCGDPSSYPMAGNFKRKCTSDLPTISRKHKKSNLLRHQNRINESTESPSEPMSSNSTRKDTPCRINNLNFNTDKILSPDSLLPSLYILPDPQPVINLFEYKSYRIQNLSTPRQPKSADSGFRENKSVVKSRTTSSSSTRICSFITTADNNTNDNYRQNNGNFCETKTYSDTSINTTFIQDNTLKTTRSCHEDITDRFKSKQSHILDAIQQELLKKEMEAIGKESDKNPGLSDFKRLDNDEIIPLITVSTPLINNDSVKSPKISPTSQSTHNILPVETKTNSDRYFNSLFQPGDSSELIAFIKTIPLTHDCELDEEIVRFYRNTFDKKHLM